MQDPHDAPLRERLAATRTPEEAEEVLGGRRMAAYGLAWLAGSVLIGLLYSHGVAAVGWFVVAVQLVSVVLLLPLVGRRQRVSKQP